MPSLSPQRAGQEVRTGRRAKIMGPANGKTTTHIHSQRLQQSTAQAKLGYGDDRGAWYTEKGSLMRQCRRGKGYKHSLNSLGIEVSFRSQVTVKGNLVTWPHHRKRKPRFTPEPLTRLCVPSVTRGPACISPAFPWR